MNKAYSRVNWSNDTSKKTFINDTNLNVMDKGIDVLDDRIIDLDGRILELEGYEEEAKESAENADVSEANAKTSENNAKASETKAKEYMEKAFAGTPDGYDALVSKVDSLDIKKTTDSTLYGSKNGGARLVGMVGNTVQNGTPSPSTPQPMYHTSDVVEIEIGAYKDSDGTLISGNGYIVRSKNFVPCKAGDIVKIAYNKECLFLYLLFFDNNKNYISCRVGNNVKEFEYTAPNNTMYVTFNVYPVRNEVVDLTTLGKITLTINGKYVGQIVEHGKNCHNTNTDINGFVSSSLSQTTTSTYRITEIYPIGEDVVSWSNTSNSYLYIVYYDENKKIIKRTAILSTSKLSEKVDKTAGAYYSVCYANGGDSGSSFVYDIQIEKYTDVATPYEPYREKVVHFLTEKPMMDDSHLFREDGLFKVEHGSAEEVLDGSDESWGVQWTSPNYSYKLKLDNAIQVTNSENANLMSNRMVSYSADTMASMVTAGQIEYGIALNNAKSLIVLMKSISTVEEFKTWLSNNNLTVQYKLATPYIEVLDTESQLALNSLKTFDNVTYIESGNRTKPSEIEVEYGTSQVGAYTLQSLNNTEANAIRLNELAVAMVSLGSEV